jgi:uncharacterized membrane protein
MNWPDLTYSLNPTWPDWLPETAAVPTLLGAAALLAVLTLWTYAGAQGANGRRILAVLLLRLAALAVALLVALRPSFGVEVWEGLEPSKLLIVVDASQSMNIADGFNGMTRWDDARRILASQKVTEALKRLSADEQIEIVYYQGAEGLAEFRPQETADGKRTDIGGWLHELHQKHAGQDKLRGVLLFSDGADNGTRFPTLEQARRWRAVCPIHTFGHGKAPQDSERKDIIVAKVDAPPTVPAKTKLSVKGLVHAPGFKDAMVKVGVWIQSSTDKEPKLLGDIETRQLKDEKNTEIALVRDAPDTPDEYKLTFKVEKVDGEADDTNNEATTFLLVTREGVSVLWIEGRKRPYEPIFALRALAGDKRFRVDYTEVGANTPAGAARFGLDKQQYDVIVIGDLNEQQFSGGDPAVHEQIRDLVRDKKVGLMMLGGIDTFGRGRWNKTALAEVLPVQFDTEQQIDELVRFQPDEKALAVRFPFLILDDDATQNEKLWGKDFFRLDGAALLGTVKEGATVLGRKKSAKNDGVPLMVAGVPGGRVLVFGGDTTWKAWLRPGTLDAFNKFWRQSMLWLAHQDDRAGNLWVEPRSRRLLAGSSDRLEFAFGLRGKMGKGIAGAKYTVNIEGPGVKIPIQPTPMRGKEADAAGKEHAMSGTLAAPPTAGEYLLKIAAEGKDADGSTLADKKAVHFLLVSENLELQRKAPDLGLLEDISQMSGGRFSPADETTLLKLVGEVRGQVRKESHAKTVRWPDWDRHPASDSVGDQVAGLWGTAAPLWFLAFATLLGLEWGLRRMWGMV